MDELGDCLDARRVDNGQRAMSGVQVERADDEGNARVGGEPGEILGEALNGPRPAWLFEEGQMSGGWSARMAYWGMGSILL